MTRASGMYHNSVEILNDHKRLRVTVKKSKNQNNSR